MIRIGLNTVGLPCHDSTDDLWSDLGINPEAAERAAYLVLELRDGFLAINALVHQILTLSTIVNL